MPKLPQETQEAVANDDGERPEYEAIEGYALVKLVEATEGDEGESGFAGQTLKFKVLEPREHRGQHVWEYISYAPGAAFKWKQFWDSVGYTYDSDTDEVIDEEDELILNCYPEVQKKGKNKGKMNTAVNEFLEATEENRALI
jgi:hypothetical protein